MGASPQLVFAESQSDALRGADALVVVTEWKEFRNPDFDAIKQALREPLIFDGRNLYDPALLRLHGIRYHGIGRGTLPVPDAPRGSRPHAQERCHPHPEPRSRTRCCKLGAAVIYAVWVSRRVTLAPGRFEQDCCLTDSGVTLCSARLQVCLGFLDR